MPLKKMRISAATTAFQPLLPRLNISKIRATPDHVQSGTAQFNAACPNQLPSSPRHHVITQVVSQQAGHAQIGYGIRQNLARPGAITKVKKYRSVERPIGVVDVEYSACGSRHHPGEGDEQQGGGGGPQRQVQN